MMTMKWQPLLFLFLVMLVALLVGNIAGPSFLRLEEPFVNRDLLAAPGAYPFSEDNGLLVDSDYQETGAQHTGNKGAADMWWQQPVFGVGSYQQITNNIRYPRATDEGRCTPAEFCDVLYRDREPKKTNVVSVLPPVGECSDSDRNGYFHTATHPLKTFTNTGNIMY
jgi:hypothetical protein